ncbi:aldose 1-epimerase family protein [Algoriphagus lutimaris]|uniref:aldose 1-epimerase family protein n=1 Tax=Algoriphagus lutimaris TaxID=613197 RepID=UPI00196A1EC8|nr:aldose 1-epimerase family protein [Algoriphagus lutimaris]MBN3519102.1 aldose 1-epimerase family protein [Algoriphagus lutimaris]
MLFTIESDLLIVKINSKGMELSSIHSKTTKLEYLWQGDPQYWTGQAPILFPIIGALKDGKTMFQGKEYELPKHGFIRNSELGKVIKQEKDRLVFQVTSSPETLAIYPFHFVLEITFQVIGNCLEVKHLVKNTGEQDMYYSLGGHPAFACPIHTGEKYDEYAIEFPEVEQDHTWLIQPNGLIGNEGDQILNNSNLIPLQEHIFDADALIFKHLKSKKASLVHQKQRPVLEVEFEDFDYLGIWAKPGAPFVCIEPWLGIADSVNASGKLIDKEGIRKLSPGNSEIKSYQIRILEE